MSRDNWDANKWLQDFTAKSHEQRMQALAEDGSVLDTLCCMAEQSLRIRVVHCVHCDTDCLNPQSDLCRCGAELYPMELRIRAGDPIPTRIAKEGK